MKARVIVDDLLAEGFTVRRTTKGHYFVSLNGKPVTTLPGTPSDWRSYKNAMAAIKRAKKEQQ